jgi:simple sugar transport system permease protein
MTDSFLNTMAPLLLAALGAFLTEYAGFLCIAIEGFMNLGLFFGFALSVLTGSALAGTLLGAILTALLGFLLVIFIKTSGSNPFVAGLAFNLGTFGLCGALSLRYFGTGGVIRNAAFSAAPPMHVGLLEKIPLLGRFLSPHSPFVYAAFLLLILEAVLVKSTVFGLRLRAAGLSPKAAVERGLSPWRYRQFSWAAAGFLSALAGAALTFRVGVYAPGGAGIRPWIALAAVFLGFRTVWGVLAASAVLALAENLSFFAQGAFPNLAAVLLGLPSALALVLYCAATKLKVKYIWK